MVCECRVILFYFMLSYQKLLSVVDELESLKPEFDRRVNELEKVYGRSRLPPPDEQEIVSNSRRPSPYVNGKFSLILDQKQVSTLNV